MPTCKRQKKAVIILVSCVASLKAFVKLECCIPRRIKAQFFFLWSQINTKAHYRRRVHLQKDEVSNVWGALYHKKARTTAPLLPSLIIITPLSCSNCWRWQDGHRIRAGNCSSLNTQKPCISFCSFKYIKSKKGGYVGASTARCSLNKKQMLEANKRSTFGKSGSG